VNCGLAVLSPVLLNFQNGGFARGRRYFLGEHTEPVDAAAARSIPAFTDERARGIVSSVQTHPSSVFLVGLQTAASQEVAVSSSARFALNLLSLL
jgi:hypothetical protein